MRDPEHVALGRVKRGDAKAQALDPQDQSRDVDDDRFVDAWVRTGLALAAEHGLAARSRFLDGWSYATAMPASRRTVEQETERVRAVQDKQAPKYDRQISFFERILFGDGRAWVCSQARGRVLELAAGTGRNLSFYPPDVELTAIELSPEMLAIGRQRAQELGHPVDLRLGDVQSLDFPDESFDTVTCTLGFCTIPDTPAAAAEAFRVLRPGGQLLLMEHVRSPIRIVRGAQRVLEPLAVRFEADHLLRDPLDYLPSVGFQIDEVQRSKWGIVERLRALKPGVR
jgi:ubiquinone/menaquinone biosynthesis C-methylase UbiE